MSETDAPNICRNFLEEIDRYLENNWQTIKCSDIHFIYDRLFNDLKEFKGNSNGFTGLSEYLIFRFLYHFLGGSFVRQEVTPHLWEFVSNTNNNLRIGQSVPVYIGKKRKYPDIVFYDNNELRVSIPIKIYLTGGLTEVNKEINILRLLKKNHPKMKALLVIFNKLSDGRRAKILPHLNKIKQSEQMRNWFSFLILQEDPKLLKDVLKILLNNTCRHP